MIINIAIVDDNQSFADILSILLENIKSKVGVIEKHIFTSPLAFLESKVNFDIAIVDCIFKGFPSKVNGIALSKEIKNRFKNCKVILNSEFANREFLPIIEENSSSIDFFTDKNMSNNNLIERVSHFIDEVIDYRENLFSNTLIKLYLYKSHKETFKMNQINYAKTKDRKKHLISVYTTNLGEVILSKSITQFVNYINSELIKSGANSEEKKMKSDFYINRRNVESFSKDTVIFKDGSKLDIK